MSHADRMLTGQQSQGRKTYWKPLTMAVTAQPVRAQLQYVCEMLQPVRQPARPVCCPL